LEDVENGYENEREGGSMTRHQVLELLIRRDIPRDLASIEATIRAINSRVDAADGTAEYDEIHHRLDELLTARERALETGRRSEVLV
jgi:hypothetical protein